MERHGVDTRMVWTGNVTRQPAFRDLPCRIPRAGLPNADTVMEQGIVLPSNHALSDEDIDYIWHTAELFLDMSHGESDRLVLISADGRAGEKSPAVPVLSRTAPPRRAFDAWRAQYSNPFRGRSAEAPRPKLERRPQNR